VTGAFSHSRLTVLDDCPRRYRFRYVEKLAEAFQTAEAFMGTMVHEALQWLYLEREASREPSADELVAKYHDTWRQKHGPGIRVVQEAGAIERFLADGEDMLRRHHRGPFAADRLQTLAIEPKVSLTLQAGEAEPATYVGYIDRLARDAGGIMHVIDFKTSRRMPGSFDEAGLQVRGYGLGVLEMHGGVEVALRYEYLRHDRRLEETMSRTVGNKVAAQLVQRVRRALEAERLGDYPARPGALCRWCGYREACDASPFHASQLQPVMSVQTDACPLCGSGLKLRASSRGEMVACAKYPGCLHSREVLPGDRERLAGSVR